MGKFARLCIELDLTKPLEAFIQINQVWCNIEYEDLPNICYMCGRYGKKKNCKLKATAAVENMEKISDVVPSRGDHVTMEQVLLC